MLWQIPEFNSLLNSPCAPSIANLLALFQALEIKEGREAIIAALQEVREKFKAVAGK